MQLKNQVRPKVHRFSCFLLQHQVCFSIFKNSQRCQRNTDDFQISCKTCNKHNKVFEREKQGKSLFNVTVFQIPE